MTESNVMEEMGENCGVCGQRVDTEKSSTCRFCGKSFHMVWDTSKQTDVPTCGRVQVDEMSLGIVFVCNLCERNQRG